MSENINELIYEIRVCYQSLQQLGEAFHEGIGVSMGQRAVMEYLSRNGSSTVPRIAEERRVSRQRIQTLVNQLMEKSFVEIKSNPASKRSPLVLLTDSGSSTIATMKKQEEGVIQQCSVSATKARETTSVLRELRASLEANAVTS